jgi:hypothetical protein
MTLTRPTNEPPKSASLVNHPAAGASLPNSCGRCPARWAGSNTAHCASCHRTFSSPSAFDDHRIRNTVAGGCIDPAKAGMVEHQRVGYSVWGYPSDEGAADRFSALRAAQ